METGADREGLSLCLLSSMKVDVHRPGSCGGRGDRCYCCYCCCYSQASLDLGVDVQH